jgi:hypothetical protein
MAAAAATGAAVAVIPTAVAGGGVDIVAVPVVIAVPSE